MSGTEAQHVKFEDLPGDGTPWFFEGQDQGTQTSILIGIVPPDGAVPLHRHPYEETFIIQEGVARITVGEETIEAGADQIVVIPASAPHKFMSAGPDTLRAISVHPVAKMEMEWLEGGE